MSPSKPITNVKQNVHKQKPHKGKIMEINTILYSLLTTKRPTNNPSFCLTYTQELLRQQGIEFTTDGNMNVIVDRQGSTCFTSHQDTVDNKLGNHNLTSTPEGMVSVLGGGVLGADCGSGMYIMIRMILAGKAGLYVFFSTEEQGRVGSGLYIMPEHITKCVSFDRKGTDNLITHQMSERGCSDAFADAFIDRFALPYKKDPTGSFTDSYSFFAVVPECINLSVGYYNQHTKQESQDLPFLESLVDACIDLDWDVLPVERDPNVMEYANDWGNYTYPKTKSWNTSWNNKLEYDEGRDIEDFVYAHPYVVSELLQEYGITLRDLNAYKREMDSYVYGDDDEEAEATIEIGV